MEEKIFLTIREQAAIAAMQGMLANNFDYESVEVMAEKAVKCADALVKELNREGELETCSNHTVTQLESLSDGIYVVYEDGKHELFNGKNCTENVSHIGIKLGHLSLGLKLNSFDDCTLPETNHDIYITSYDKAIQDWNGKENTQRLKDVGLDIKLLEDEWLPSLGEYIFIFCHSEALNEALAYLGGDKLVNDWYWSSTEHDSNKAWPVYSTMFDGWFTESDWKYGSCLARAVCAF